MDLREVDRLQAELLAIVDEMTAEPDVEKQQALVRRITEMSDRLQLLCDELEAEARATSRDQRGTFEVELTADQRDKVRTETGVTMTSLSVSDDGGGLMRVMPAMTRETILSMALDEAWRRRRDEEARKVAAAELERITEELRRDAPEQVRQEIERLLADPAFRAVFEPRNPKQRF
ncbi:MAG: hypothetical protein ABI321_15300 [Polyangia bacterium]